MHVLSALARFLVSSWPWRSLAYVTTTAPIAACVWAGLAVVALPWVATGRLVADGRPVPTAAAFIMVVCVVLAAAVGPPLSVALAVLERQRLAMVDRRPVTSGHQPTSGSATRWLRTRFTEAATWREVGYAVVLGTVVPVVYGGFALLSLLDLALVLSPWLVGHDGGPISVGFSKVTTPGQAVPYAVAGIALLPALPYLLGLLAAGQAALARALLCETGKDSTEVREVARSRARLVDTYEAERRRIERDLHDGAQHRLTSLTLQLGLARLDVPDDSTAAEPLARAHEQAKELMVVLRDLIHGIHPQDLTELGLLGAVRQLATQLPIPVTIAPAKQWAGRLPELVESTAYFAAAEALTNVARHSGATRAEVTFTHTGKHVIMEVRDDGRGGADPANGTGLTGLADRAAAVNGRLLLSSPDGGPTLVRVDLPCDQ